MKKLLYIILVLGFSITLKGAHIVGGVVTYACNVVNLESNRVKFDITAIIYRDNKNNGAPFDNPAEFGLYIKNGSNWDFIRTYSPSLDSNTELSVNNPNPCLDVPKDIGVDEGVYKFPITLDISTKSYLLVYQRCCRNQSIKNIKDPGEAGAAYFVEISPEAQTSCNNSPVFNGFPPIVICANDPLVFDHSASDVEGDLIKYAFCAPVSAGGSRGGTGGPGATECDGVKPNPKNCPPPFDVVEFEFGYSPNEPINGSPALTIHPVTGLIEGKPTTPGQYVVGVCAEEWRNGVKIGEIRRDFQFNVAECDPLVYADIDLGVELSSQNFDIVNCGSNFIHINNKSYLEENIDAYLWEFYIGNDTLVKTTKHLDISFPDLGDFDGRLILNPGTQCADTAFITVHIYPDIVADFSFDYDTCVAGPVKFVDLSVTGSDTLLSWDWQLSNDTMLSVQNPIYQFALPGQKNIKLISTDVNGCKDTIIKTVDYFPTPTVLEIEPSSFIGCSPQSIFFNNVSFPIDTSYNFIWDFGDGVVEDGHMISPTHVYDNPGNYSVELKVISPIGCEVVETFPSWITIKEKPIADFSYNPESPTIFNNTVNFNNLSTGATGYNWYFDGAGGSFSENPIVTFQDTGHYSVRLIVKNHENCTDTAYAELFVFTPVLLHFPNAFTPNNDALNDVFLPKGIYEVIQDYKLDVYNRWGERIFESKDPAEGWNGQKYNSGALSPVGVYVFHASYLDEKKNRKEVKGHISLIR